MSDVPHIRQGSARPERRIGRRQIIPTTVCGAPITDKDIAKSDVRAAVKAHWPICWRCLEAVS